MLRWLYKWLICSWAHYKDRCYPEVWRIELGPWHCSRCHPCSEELDKIMEQYK